MSARRARLRAERLVACTGPASEAISQLDSRVRKIALRGASTEHSVRAILRTLSASEARWLTSQHNREEEYPACDVWVPKSRHRREADGVRKSLCSVPMF